MKTTVLVFLLLVIGVTTAYGQMPCGFDQHQQQLMTDPNYVLQQQQLEDYIYNQVRMQHASRTNSATTCQPDGVYTLPLKITIVDVDGTPLITDTQVNDAIIGANERWRRTVGDGADMEIQFTLAKQDPDGNPTTGISHVDGRLIPGYVQVRIN